VLFRSLGLPYAAGPARASMEDISRAVTRVAPAVVRIDTTIGGGSAELLPGLFGAPAGLFPQHGQASGIIVNGRRGYVLTNAHVVQGARSIRVTLSSGRRLRGKVLGVDALTDIAVVQVPGGGLPQAELGSSDRLPVGSWVAAVGNPFGLDNTVTAGVLSAKGRTIAGEGGAPVTDLLQTDAPINEGNSGGALIDLRGQVVGMPTAIVEYAQGIGFAVAIDTAKRVLVELIRRGRVAHAWLGIGAVDRPQDDSVAVQSVAPNSPAARAGLRTGDVVMAVGGRRIRSSDDIAGIIRAHRPGDKVAVVVRRGQRQTKLTARLGEAPQTAP
jgi:S1-C subfamily serine protease